MARAWTLEVRFASRIPPAVYVSPDVRFSDPGWSSEIFRRPIESIRFHLPTGHAVYMAGMEKYCFFVEATQSLSRWGDVRIEAFWLCGKLPGKPVTDMWRVGGGKVIHQHRPYGREWGGTPVAGWKQGAVGKTPLSVLIEG